MAILRIRVPKWRDFNPRKDVKKPSWFRLAHDLFENEDFYDFSHGEILSWIYILCACSKKNHDSVTISLERVKTVGRINEKVFRAAVKKLEACGSVVVCGTGTLRVSDADDTDTNATYGRTDVQDGGDGTNEHARGAPPPGSFDSEDPEAETARAHGLAYELEDYYLQQYRGRFKAEALRTPEDFEALLRLIRLKGLRPERLKRLINAYVYMDDKWFSQQGWNLCTLETDIQKINARVAA